VATSINARKFLPWVHKSVRALRGTPKLPTTILAVAAFVAIFGNLVTPYSPVAIDLRHAEMPPSAIKGGTWEHPLGTDRKGRDVLSRILVGTRNSLSVAAASIVIGGLIGTTLGLLAGYRGGWVDAVIMRSVDAMLAFPAIMVALILAAATRPGYWVVVITLVLLVWPRFARLVRGEILSLKERDFVALARVAGASPLHIVVKHLLPNILNTIVVLATLQMGWAIIIEASLSFLGVGIPPPTPTWGNIIAEDRTYVTTIWWTSVFAGVAIALVGVSVNLFGDWLRDALDPKLRQI
jgi:peptide/nickel transport system permease protein